MKQLQVIIEGPDTTEATEALITLSGITAEWQPADTGLEKGGLATIATIIGIVGGSMAVAEQIRKWYQEWKKGKSGKNIEKVVLISGSKHLLLEDATKEQIKEVLDILN